MPYNALLESICKISRQAGAAIMPFYKRALDVQTKTDGSPLTLADEAAHHCIVDALALLTPDIPVLSEESSAQVLHARHQWQTYWLVDPLDGTKEFVNQHDSFTVNIALIENGYPILGVVYTPAMDVLHYAAVGVGAFMQEGQQQAVAISVRKVSSEDVVMVASRSHASTHIQAFEANLQNHFSQVSRASMGSSLKICRVAQGQADIYPRLGPTSEWDTAAAQCVLEQAGGGLTDINGSRLRYNKTDILNPWFLAFGDNDIDWAQFYCV